VAKTHLKLLRDVEKMHSQFRELLYSRGLNASSPPKALRSNNSLHSRYQFQDDRSSSHFIGGGYDFFNNNNSQGYNNNNNQGYSHLQYQHENNRPFDLINTVDDAIYSHPNNSKNSNQRMNYNGQGVNPVHHNNGGGGLLYPNQQTFGNFGGGGGGGGGGVGSTLSSSAPSSVPPPTHVDQYNGFQQQRGVYGQSAFQDPRTDINGYQANNNGFTSSMPDQYHGSSGGRVGGSQQSNSQQTFVGNVGTTSNRPFGYAMNVKSGPSSSTGSSTRGY
jgi:hypothetical protein